MGSGRDRAFDEFVAREGETLRRCAYLCHGDVAPARDAVEAALAKTYADWGRTANPRLDALSALSHRSGVPASTPWRSQRRIDLVDVAPTRPPRASMLVRELDDLPDQGRRVLVLSLIGGLSVAEIARGIEIGEGDVERSLESARGQMDARRGAYGSRGTLAEALLRAVPEAMIDGGYALQSHRAHGRFLIWARRKRVLGLAAASVAMVTLVVQGVGVFQSRQDLGSERPAPVASIVASSGPSFAPTPPVGEAECDTTQSACQAVTARLWQYDIFDVAVEYLDPEGDYFSTVQADEDAWTWNGEGALAVDVRSLNGGTEVSIEIASSREFAAQCGAKTDRDCTRQRFMSGNWFNLTESSNAAQGVEVQYVPYDQVITISASDVGTGKKLPIDRGQILMLIQDPRLRLPAIS